MPLAESSTRRKENILLLVFLSNAIKASLAELRLSVAAWTWLWVAAVLKASGLSPRNWSLADAALRVVSIRPWHGG
jgi:hypothetical protein